LTPFACTGSFAALGQQLVAPGIDLLIVDELFKSILPKTLQRKLNFELTIASFHLLRKFFAPEFLTRKKRDRNYILQSLLYF
jgi:hypothetical protein